MHQKSYKIVLLLIQQKPQKEIESKYKNQENTVRFLILTRRVPTVFVVGDAKISSDNGYFFQNLKTCCTNSNAVVSNIDILRLF